MTDLSIIIVSYNTQELTLACIDSIFRSSSKVKSEVIVVDNASTDESVKEIKKRFPKVKIIENSKNVGFAKANNMGIKVSQGAYVLLLISDTEVKKGSIDNLLNFAKEQKDAGAVLPRLLNTDSTVQGSVFKLPSLYRSLRQYWFGEKGLLDKYSPKKTQKVEGGVMAAFLITPKGLAAGSLNEDYFLYFEDLDYC